MTFTGLIVITDLDGTLLDEETYSYEASLPAIQQVTSLGIPLILCSSKTRGEMLPLWKELALADPFIVENGGAIYFPAGYFSSPVAGSKSQKPFEVLELGIDVRKLRRTLTETAAGSRATVRSFGSMTVDEISALTGLTRDQARLAAKREYDEPFLVDGGDREKLFRALIGKGFTLTQGDRFFHLIGSHSKGNAVRILLDLYRQRERNFMSVGLGNSANDLPLLLQVDRPILIRKQDGSYDSEVTRVMPHIEKSRESGPLGWRATIEAILQGTVS